MTDLALKPISDDQKLRIAVEIALRQDSISENEDDPRPDPLIKLGEAALSFGVEVGSLTQLLNEPGFLKLLKGLTKARASLTIHGVGITRLTEIAAHGSPKDAMSAIKMLAQLTGDLKTGVGAEVKQTFQAMMERMARLEKRDPLTKIIDIKPTNQEDDE